MLRTVPANQRFITKNLRMLSAYNGLVNHTELARSQAAFESTFYRQAVLGHLIERRVEYSVPISPLTLGGVEGEVRPAHQLRFAMVDILVGDANRGAHLHLVAGNHPGLGANLQNLRTEAGDPFASRRLNDYTELVSTEPGQHTARRNDTCHGDADLPNELVASVMTQRVVNRLEPIEVDDQQGLRLATTRQPRGQFFNESRAI